MTESISRRTAIGTLVAAIGGFWAVVVGALATVYAATPLRAGAKGEGTKIGDRSLFGEAFKAFRLRTPVRDGWYEHIEQRTLYIKEDPDNPAKLIVFSSTCSHLGCTVRWDEAIGEFECPCHGGRFASDGSVLAGPPPAPLERLEVEMRGTDVWLV